MEIFINCLVLLGFVVIAVLSLKMLMKKEQSADLGEEHRPYNSYTNGTAKTKLDQSFPPKEFGEAKGSKYQKQRSCQQ